MLAWSLRLNDGRLVRKRTQGTSKGQVRSRAKAKALALLTNYGGRGWELSSPILKYIEEVSRPALERAELRPSSRARYLAIFELLVGRCVNTSHRHTESMKNHTIRSGTRFRTLEKCLQEIARLHGSGTAKHAQNILSKYVIGQLIRDELLENNPLYGMHIDLIRGAKLKTYGKQGGVALTRNEYLVVLNYLLEFDPTEGVLPPKRGSWTLDDRIAIRQNAIDLTLLQAGTGLRITEANRITWGEHVQFLGEHIYIRVSEDISKTRRERRIPILDARVVERMQERYAKHGGVGYVIGAPSDNTKIWDSDNCRNKGTTPLYLAMSRELGIEAFRTERTHVWRATLNTLLLDTVPEVVRSAYFGHTESVNRGAYTDFTDTTKMLTAARKILDDWDSSSLP